MEMSTANPWSKRGLNHLPVGAGKSSSRACLQAVSHSLTHLPHLRTKHATCKPGYRRGCQIPSATRQSVIVDCVWSALCCCGNGDSSPQRNGYKSSRPKGILAARNVCQCGLESIRMSDTAGWTEQISCGQLDEKSSTVSRAALLSVLILLLAIGASAWIYCNETRALARLASPLGAEVNLGSLRPNTALLDQFDHWVFWVIVAT